MPKMPLWLFVLCLLPIAIDGFTQLFGLRDVGARAEVHHGRDHGHGGWSGWPTRTSKRR